MSEQAGIEAHTFKVELTRAYHWAYPAFQPIRNWMFRQAFGFHDFGGPKSASDEA